MIYTKPMRHLLRVRAIRQITGAIGIALLIVFCCVNMVQAMLPDDAWGSNRLPTVPASQPPLPPVAPATALVYDPLVAGIMSQVSASNLSQTIRALQNTGGSGGPGSRYSYHPNLRLAAQYIGQRFASFGLVVNYDVYGSPNQGYITNVIGTLPGAGPESSEILIISAHYDSIANRTPGGWNSDTQSAPGADDDGSGVATVIETARILSNYSFSRTIRFVTFSGEEQGLLGSLWYAAAEKDQGANIVGVLQLDMVAWDSNNDGAMEIDADLTAASQQLAQRFSDVRQIYNENGISPHLYYGAGRGTSDHKSFWQQSYPAVLISEDSTNDFNIGHYHTTGDLLETLNVPYMTRIARVTAGTLATLAGPTSYESGILETDLNTDNTVDAEDLRMEISRWRGAPLPPAMDYDSDDRITVNDIMHIAKDLGKTGP
ncbi:MAG: M20/M25/M40 family metallo-hydrolase [Chloroflexi bacterium]|nr:M20/M25/M40 family metallo-hydrolase [Chloroflexota bacterium]